MNEKRNHIVILLADDDEEDRMLSLDALTESRLSSTVFCVEDGEDMMNFLHRRGKYAPPADAPRPGLILLDLNMPKMDGREALREIKADPELRKIPVVVMTNSQAEEDIAASYDEGASSYITKPVSFAGMIQVMQGLGKYWSEIVDLPEPSESDLRRRNRQGTANANAVATND